MVESKKKKIKELYNSLLENDRPFLTTPSIDGSVFATDYIKKRRDILRQMLELSFPNLGKELLSKLSFIFQSSDVLLGYDAELILKLVENKECKELLQDTIHIIQESMRRTEEIKSRLDDYKRNVLVPNETKLEAFRFEKASFKQIAPLWETLIDLRRKLLVEKSNIEQIRTFVNEGKKRLIEKLNHLRDRKDFRYYKSKSSRGNIQGIFPVVKKFFSTRHIKELVRIHSELFERTEYMLKQLKESLDYINAKTSERIRLNTTLLNVLFLMGAIAQCIALLQLSGQVIVENLSLGLSLMLITVIITLICFLIFNKISTRRFL